MRRGPIRFTWLSIGSLLALHEPLAATTCTCANAQPHHADYTRSAPADDRWPEDGRVQVSWDEWIDPVDLEVELFWILPNEPLPTRWASFTVPADGGAP